MLNGIAEFRRCTQNMQQSDLPCWAGTSSGLDNTGTTAALPSLLSVKPKYASSFSCCSAAKGGGTSAGYFLKMN